MSWGRRRLGAADQGRQGDAEGLEHDASAAGGGVAQDVALGVLFDLSFAQAFEVVHDVGPFEAVTVRGQAILELLAHDQGEERAEDVAAEVSSYLWKIGRVASSDFAERKMSSTIHRSRYRSTACNGVSAVLVRST